MYEVRTHGDYGLNVEPRWTVPGQEIWHVLLVAFTPSFYTPTELRVTDGVHTLAEYPARENATIDFGPWVFIGGMTTRQISFGERAPGFNPIADMILLPGYELRMDIDSGGVGEHFVESWLWIDNLVTGSIYDNLPAAVG